MMSEQEHPDEVVLAMRMMRLTRKRFQLNDIKLEKIGIGPGQVMILLDLERMRSCRQRELAEHMQLTPATISAALKRLEKNGLITRTADTTDARATVVALSEAGKDACNAARKVLVETDREICAGIGGDGCREMIAYFDIMLNNVEKAMEGTK